jgi:hypothetical protein
VKLSSRLIGSWRRFVLRDRSLGGGTKPAGSVNVKFGERHGGAFEVKSGVVQCLGHGLEVNDMEPRQARDEDQQRVRKV